MTRTIDAALLAAQKKTALTPSLQAVFSDNGLPHYLTAIAYPMTGFSGSVTSSCLVTGGTPAIIRAHRVSGTGVQVQRITNPATSSQWTSGWTTLAAGANYPALFFTGTSVICVYQIEATKQVQWKRSSDGGQSWSIAQAIWTPAYFLNAKQIGVSAGGGTSGFFYANSTYLYFRRYHDDTDTWDAEQSHNTTFLVGTVGAAYTGAGNVYRLVYVVDDYASWTEACLLAQSYTYPSTWGTKVPILGVHGQGTDAYNIALVHLAKLGTYYHLNFYLSSDTGGGGIFDTGDHYSAVSDDGVYFTGPVKLSQTNIADRFQPLTWPATGVTYLSCDTVLMTSTPPADVTATTGQIVDYDLEDHGPTAYLRMTLDNRDGTFDDLATSRLGCDLALERGAVVGTTAYRVARETFVVDRIQRSLDGRRARVTAYNTHRLLDLWHAELLTYYAGLTLSGLVETIAALAGIHSCTFDANAVWSTAIGEFAIQPGRSAAEALAPLQEQFQFVSRISAGTNLHSFVLSASPGSDYTFGAGAGEHPTLTYQDTAQRTLPAISHAMVIGSGAGAHAVATALQAETGRQLTHMINRAYITTTAEAAAVADAVIDKVEASISKATLTCLPAFHLQPFDVVTSDDFQPGTKRYIAAIREVYHPLLKEVRASAGPASRMAWYQTYTLAELSRPTAGPGLDAITPQSLVKSEIRRGTLIGFDSTTWKATLHVDGSMAAVTLPCATWLQPVQLTANRRLAVLLFDASNPADGLVIGTYGYPGWPLDMYPNNDEAGLLQREVYRFYPNVAAGTAGDDFDGSAWASGWTGWAGAPFATPTTVWSYPSCVSMTCNGTLRAFRYRTGTLNAVQAGKFAMLTNAVGAFIGLRIDDGTDNNCAELALRYTALNQYDVISRYRTGGGAVTTTVHKLIEYPIWIVLDMYPVGSQWSNWGAWGDMFVDSPGGYILNFSSGFTWTPARKGLVFNAVNAGTWQAHLCDWYR